MTMTTPTAPPGRRYRPRLPAGASIGLLVASLLALAAGAASLGGWLWWRWWSPAPAGEIFQRRDLSYSWYATPLDPGQTHVASGTFEYVLVGLGLALLVGIVIAVLGRNRPFITLGTAVAAAALGAWLMWWVGVAMSPPDPQRWADKAHLGKHLKGHLAVAGWTPYLVWPVGCLLGFLGVMLTISGERAKPPV
ncbi:hypothetical protein [Nocardioides montaniterrae]